MGDKEVVRRHICFYGRVQGVGFRFTAMQLAQGLGLTGWVKNVEDFVEMEVQGEETSIERPGNTNTGKKKTLSCSVF